MNRTLRRFLIRSTITAASLVAMVGLLHTPYARPLLMRVGGCPVGNVSAKEVEQISGAAILHDRGTQNSPERVALEFVLEETSKSDVSKWAAKHGIACREKLEGHLVLCANVPANAVGRAGYSLTEVSFSFRTDDKKLLSVATLSKRAAEGPYLTNLAADLKRQLGQPSHQSGNSIGLSTYVQSHRFANYWAELLATPIGHEIVIREQYSAIAAP